jgi:hypothetical protein
MERFIHGQNIEHYERLLRTVTNEAERKRILNLLEEEKRKPIWTVHRKQNAGHRELAMTVRAIPSTVLGALQSVAWLPRLSTRREYNTNACGEPLLSKTASSTSRSNGAVDIGSHFMTGQFGGRRRQTL